MNFALVFRIIAPGILILGSASGYANTSVIVDTQAYDWTEDSASDTVTGAAISQSVARFGPFSVVTPDRVELSGSIESDTPAQFSEMLRAFPAIRQIDMIECPGTGDDEANLALARMVRKAGIATFVPDNGSVRSGGVELFLAGAKRSAAPDAEFAVHSWLDEDGLEPDDYADSDPVNREYVNYYREMGMSDEKAKAFYAMTNSVPHDDALYLKPRDIAEFLTLN